MPDSKKQRRSSRMSCACERCEKRKVKCDTLNKALFSTASALTGSELTNIAPRRPALRSWNLKIMPSSSCAISEITSQRRRNSNLPNTLPVCREFWTSFHLHWKNCSHIYIPTKNQKRSNFKRDWVFRNSGSRQLMRRFEKVFEFEILQG